MSTPDLNLLLTLDAVLSEGSVTRAAQRLGLSPSAMSRALARLRETTGDPLLVRAGRGLVPTPRAVELRDQVSHIVQAATQALRPAHQIDIAHVARSFTLRTREGFVENFGAQLLARARAEAPAVRLCFIQKTNKDSAELREGRVDLETGVISKATSPEVRTRILFKDRFVGVVRSGHALSTGEISPQRYAQGRHVFVSRFGIDKGMIDDALKPFGLDREISTTVDTFSSALALARSSDMIASVPERQTQNLRGGLHSFPLPFLVPEVTVSMQWHPRFDADQAHRWLRSLVLDTCGQAPSL
jgi:DNA-binding transcriptional LysR family regulator